MVQKKWYTAVLVFRSAIEGDKTYEPLTELQFRLLQAGSPESAYSVALAIGEEEKHSYKNSQGEIVRWQFVGLFDLAELLESDLHSGAEIYSQTVRSDPSKYIVPKERLTVFWSRTNNDRPASDLLNEEG